LNFYYGGFMKARIQQFFILLMLFISSNFVFAGDSAGGKVSGYMFGDYYYEFSNPDDSLDALNQNGFQFRRIYLTYDNDISGDFSVRFRLEMKSEAGETITPFIKNAYLTWKNFIPNATIYFGAQGTPIWKVSEKTWGYRSVEKTIMDKRKVGSSSDMGLAVKGKLSESSSFGYHVLVANGEGKKGEKNQYKKVFVSLPIKILEDFQLVPYADYEGVADNKNKQLLALFAGVKKESFQGGIEVFQKTHEKANNGKDIVENGISVFGSVKLTEELRGFARYDMYELDTDTKDDGNNYIVAGLDVKLAKNVHLMPNVKMESYETNGKDPMTQGAVTFFYKF